jgi:hypothetical protein
LSHLKNNQIFSMKALQIQWVEGRTADQAAKAFHRINRGGTVIDPLEARILQAGQSALSISTRVITHGGSGYAYWHRFTDERAKEGCPEIGKEIHKILFEPELRRPIKTVEVPLGGTGYGTEAMRLAFDLVSAATNSKVPDSSKAKIDYKALPKDDDGIQTLNFLRLTRKSLNLVLSNDPSSFGLHPALWFYSENGEFQPAALLNIVDWISHLSGKNKLDLFRKNRGKIEELIIKHRGIVKPATHTLGSGRRTRGRAFAILNRVLELISSGTSIEESWKTLCDEFKGLGGDRFSLDRDEGEKGAAFNATAKSTATLSDLASVSRCRLCGGLLHPNGKTLDHIEKRAAGGSSAVNNSRWVHPVCNSNREKDENPRALSD